MQSHKMRVLKQMNKKKGYAMTEQQLRKALFDLFDRFDKDKDGQLNMEQFSEMMNFINSRHHGK